MTETAVPRISASVGAGDPVDLGRVHFVGVGGSGMLPLARVCAERGYTVSGSDIRRTEGVEELRRLGATVYVGHRADQVPADATAVVFTHSVGPDNPEIRAAQRRGVPLAHRSAALNTLMSAHTARIGVLGTHGKTSTAAMLAAGLTRMEHAPAYAVGGETEGPASGGRAGDGGAFFVAEVDESDRSHLGVSVNVAVITDIGHDHPECYAGVEDHIDAYEEFVRGMPSDGVVVLNGDSPACRELASRLAMSASGPRLVTFGTSPNVTWRLADVVSQGGVGRAALRGPGGLGLDLVLRIAGVHQLMNAAAAVAVSHALNLDHDLFVAQLGSFDGVARRLSLAGEAGGVLVLDSYAHHPTEVRADLVAARSLLDGPGRVLAVFQPTGRARLAVFGEGFGAALAGCEEVVLTDGGSTVGEDALRDLAVAVAEAGGKARSVEVDRADAVACAAAVAAPGDVVVLIGTGDLVGYGPLLITELAGQATAAA